MREGTIKAQQRGGYCVSGWSYAIILQHILWPFENIKRLDGETTTILKHQDMVRVYLYNTSREVV